MALRKKGRNRTCKMKEERGQREWKGSRRMGGEEEDENQENKITSKNAIIIPNILYAN